MPSSHVVTQGECFLSIARRYGHDWQTLYDSPDNADLKQHRPNPNVLMPGDVVSIPDKPAKSVDARVETENKFKVRLPKAKVRVHVVDGDGHGLSGKRYLLEVGDKQKRGTVPDNGLIEDEVPAHETQGTLTIFFDADGDDADPPPPHVLSLRIGHLDPIDAPSGVQARLTNLGFPCASSDEIDDVTIEMLRAFQRKNGLTESGELDDATKQKLMDLHKS
jgi:N-acetylmuramoyl-L-alanine amidase